MKIIESTGKNLVKVKDTKPGDLFRWNGEYWLRISDPASFAGSNKEKLWVIKLSEKTKSINYFYSDGTEVELVKGELYISSVAPDEGGSV